MDTPKRIVVNKPNLKTCDICKTDISLYSFSGHIKWSHNLTSDEYAKMYGEFRKIKVIPKQKRKIKKIICQLCKKEFSSVGLYTHLRDSHNITTDEYALKFGEYRPEKLRQIEYNNRLNNIDEIDKQECIICKKQFASGILLGYHIKNDHELTKLDYILNYIFNGHHPECKCGCGKKVKILNYYPYKVDYVSGHNSNPMLGKKHSEKSKLLMSVSAKERIKKYKETTNNACLPMHSKESLIKRGRLYSETMMKKKCKFYNITILSSYEDQQKNIYKFSCNDCNNTYEQYHNSYFTCRNCHPLIRSKYEQEIIQFLETFLSKETIIQNYRKLFNGSMELDIFLPNFNLAIEFNGLFWHSETGGKKDKFYHLNKTLACEQNNIHLLHIFEDDWNNKKEIIKEKLKYLTKQNKNLYKIFGRQCDIQEITFDEKQKFLETFHIQGNDISFINLGAFYKNELVSVMTFSKLNITKGYNKSIDDYYELSRFCSSYKYSCVGLFNKLLTNFIRKYSPKYIVTYANKCWSTKDNIYEKNGFKFVGETSPNYWYTNDYVNRIHRFNFTKQKLVSMGNDKTKTELQIMIELGYDRIWDCGHIRYEYDIA